MDMDANVNIKQRKSTKDSWCVFFYVHKQFLGPDQLARQATETELKLQDSHYDGEKKNRIVMDANNIIHITQ